MAAPGTRHVLLYGPPAAGKLTVGRALAERTGFRLLHNHLSIDLARHLFDFGAPGFWPTVQDVRLAMVTRAAEQGADIISTYVFSPKEDRRYIDAVHEAVARAGGTTSRVQLRPSLDALTARVSTESRLAAAKLGDAAQLRALVDDWDLLAPMGPDDVRIDNTNLAPHEVADRVIEHLGFGVAGAPDPQTWLRGRPAETLEAPPLVLRRFGPAHAEALTSAVNDSLDHLRPYMPWANGAVSVEDEAKMLADAEARFLAGRDFGFLIFSGTEVIGACGLHPRRGPGALEIGYWLQPRHTGKGHATTAAGRVVEEAFRLPAVQRVEIRCDQTNLASAGVAVRLGFRLARVEPREPQAAGETGREMVWTLTRARSEALLTRS